MERLIDADALKDDILKSSVMIDDRGIQTGYEIAIELIKRQPTIDAVPVIRCKDCIYFTPEKSGEHWNICRFYDAPKTADGYCNDAERKEE